MTRNDDYSVTDSLRSAVAVTKHIASQNYVRAVTETVFNFKSLVYLIVVSLFVLISTVIALPQAILSTGKALTEPDELTAVATESVEVIRKFFDDSYDKAYKEAVSNAENLKNSLSEDYVTETHIVSPNDDGTVSISDGDIAFILAVHSIVSAQDSRSIYRNITDNLFSDISEQYSDELFFGKVKNYASDIYKVKDAYYEETSVETVKEYLYDEEGNILTDPDTDEPLYSEKTIHYGIIYSEIIHSGEVFYENELEETKSSMWNEYSERHSAYHKSYDEYIQQIDEQIDDMKRFTLELLRTEGSVTESGRASSRSGTILRFLQSEEYANVSGMVCSDLMYPYSFYVITSGYGYRSLDGWHDGIDYAWTGCRLSDIPCAGNGVVAYAYGDCTADKNPSYGFGNLVIVYHGKQDGKDVFTLYGHCEQVYVKTGDTVSEGQVIRAIGQRGNSTGYHLHFEVNTTDGKSVIRENPEKYIK